MRIEADGDRAEIAIDYHPEATVGASELLTNLVVVGVFAHNGAYFSAPGFITSFTLASEARGRYPGSARTNTAFGQVNFNIGNAEDAVKASEDAVRLDPLDLESLVRLMAIHARLKNCEAAYELMNRAIEIEPGLGRVNGSMGMCLLLTKEDARGAKGWFENESVEFMRKTGLAITFHRLGQQGEAERQLNAMMEDYGDSAAYQYAQVFAQWGDAGKALDWLQKAIDIHDPGTILMMIDPFLDPIRELPLFQDMMVQMGLSKT